MSSAVACLPSLIPLLGQHDGFLVACYSRHPLVRQLKSHTDKPVIGIFESSITLALHLLRREDEKFGIVSTGLVWESLLSIGVNEAFGFGVGSSMLCFAGVETTGLNATDLHDSPADEVRQRMTDATKRLLNKGAKVVCLGCAGMAGMDRIVRDACVQELGE
jgi:Asp/Glu/hydantoin racemase